MSQTVFWETEFMNSFPLRRFSISEYHRMGEEGILSEDERVELIDGVIIQMSPKGTKHETSVSKLLNLLPRLLEGKAWLRVQAPIVLIEVYREPLTLANGSAGYLTRTEFVQGDTLIPQAVFDIKIAVGDMLA